MVSIAIEYQGLVPITLDFHPFGPLEVTVVLQITIWLLSR